MAEGHVRVIMALMTALSDREGGRRLLQVTLAVLAGIPFASGLAGMVVGPSTLPGDDSLVGPTLDSEYRFANAFWVAIARSFGRRCRK